MITREIIRDQALRMGIATGDMPEVDFIWTAQKAEGNQPCFGQSTGCLSLNCRWRDHCVALDSYTENVLADANIYLGTPQDTPLRKVG
jgi:hypothetical protein